MFSLAFPGFKTKKTPFSPQKKDGVFKNPELDRGGLLMDPKMGSGWTSPALLALWRG
jgi:hypothetical protein